MSLRVGIQGWGSEGDLRPLVALGAGLRRAGHAVRLELTPVDGRDYTELCERLGLPLRVIPERLRFSLDTVSVDGASANPLRVSRELVERAFYPFLDALHTAALELCEWADVVVWHYSSWYTHAAALRTGTKDVAVHFYPGLVPSRFAPPAGLPNLGPLNPALWRLAGLALDLQFRKRPAAFFERHGLPRVRHVLPDLLYAEPLNLHAFSPLLVPPQADWDPSHQVTGQLSFTDDDEPWEPSLLLRRFLDEGDKPVLLSLGSMEHLSPTRSRELLVDAAPRAGVRAIVQTKRSEVESVENGLFFLPWAPHGALLRHCAAMVHHGGAGTSHTALRAGVPSVVVPFIPEQQAWADRLRHVGAAGPSLPFKRARSDQLAQRIRDAVDDPALSERCAELAVSLSKEDGVARAVRLIEAL